MSILNAINKLKQIQQFSVEDSIYEIIAENKYFIEFLLRYQMSQGVDGNNNPTLAVFGPFYADRTIFNKEHNGIGLGAETNIVTNYMTGKFYDSIVFQSDSGSVVFTSDVEYFSKIIERSGIDIMKLNDENAKILEEEVINPQLKQKYNDFVNAIS